MIFEVDVIRESEINRGDVGACMAEGGGTVVGRGWQFEHRCLGWVSRAFLALYLNGTSFEGYDTTRERKGGVIDVT
jgi:hypothetical protein